METHSASVKKIAINYGLFLALATISLSVVIYVLGMHLQQNWWQGLLNFAFMVIAIVYGLKAFKKEGDGFLTLGDALKTGLAISLIAGIIGTIFTYLFMTVIEPDFAVKMLDVARENMIEQNPEMTQEQMDMALKMSAKFMTPWVMVAFGLIMALFFGFIISLVAGLIMKVNRPEFQ